MYVPLRSLLASALITAAACGSLHAQTDYSARTATSRFTIGAGAALGVAVPTGSLGDSMEAAPGLAFRGGLNIQYPATRVLSILLATGFELRNVGVKLNGELDPRSYSAKYFYVEPGISWSSFKLALNIGLPMGLTEPVPGAVSVEETRDADDDALAMLIEPRIGATLVLVDNKEWWLGLTLDAGIPINTFYDDAYRTSHALGDNDISATRAVNGHLGLTWQFALPGVLGK